MGYVPTKPTSVGASGKYSTSGFRSLSGKSKVKSKWGSGGINVFPTGNVNPITGEMIYGSAGGEVSIYEGTKSEKSAGTLIVGTYKDNTGTTTKSYTFRSIPGDVDTGMSRGVSTPRDMMNFVVV